MIASVACLPFFLELRKNHHEHIVKEHMHGKMCKVNGSRKCEA
jgi:hypothetical protein